MNNETIETIAHSINTAQDLDDLYQALVEVQDLDADAKEQCEQLFDWCSLPTFGPEPDSTAGVWSWDDARLLVFDAYSAHGLALIDREC